MDKQPFFDERDQGIAEAFRARRADAEKKANDYKLLQESTAYQEELLFLKRTIQDLIVSLRTCEFAATRWREFYDNYLWPAHLDDIVEAALTAQLAIENGALNPARRELRYMLEVAVNIAYVDEIKSSCTFEDRTAYYRGKNVNKSNVDHIFDLPFRMLGAHKDLFSTNVRNAWVRASNYVHLTKRRIDEKLELREKGITLGFETLDMLREVVSEVHEVCSIVMVLSFETIGPAFTGDTFIEIFDSNDSWAFHASGYVAIVDSYFDYKHERKETLEQFSKKRTGLIKYPVRPQNP